MLTKFKDGKAKDVYNVLTGNETWIYRYEPEIKRQSTVWCFPNDEPLTKVRKSRSGKRKMIAPFLSIIGHLPIVLLQNQLFL